MLYSPRIIVFNTDNNRFLEEPYEISVVTSPAVNAGIVREQHKDKDPAKVEQAIKRIVCIIFSKTRYAHGFPNPHDR
jgi:uncharacterized protein (TIGR02452 family)